MLRRLGEPVQVFGGVVSGRTVVELAHDAEADEIVERIRRRRSRHDVDIAVAQGDRLPPFRTIGREVGERQKALHRLHLRVDRLAELSCVERVSAAAGNQPQRAREVLLLKAVTTCQRLPLPAVDRLGMLRETIESARYEGGSARIEDVAFRREPERNASESTAAGIRPLGFRNHVSLDSAWCNTIVP